MKFPSGDLCLINTIVTQACLLGGLIVNPSSVKELLEEEEEASPWVLL